MADEEKLRRDIIRLAGMNGCYGYKRITALLRAQGEPPPINESISGVTLDRLWTTLRRILNGKEALYSGADYRLSAVS